MNHSEQLDPRRDYPIVPIDDLYPLLRLQQLMPNAAAQVSLLNKNDKATPDAKLLFFSLWHEEFGCSPTYRAISQFENLGICGDDQGKAILRARQCGLLADACPIDHEHTGTNVGYLLEICESILFQPLGNQRLLGSDRLCETIVSCDDLWQMYPFWFMRQKDIESTFKLLFMYLKALHGLCAERLDLHYLTAAKYLGLSKSTIASNAEKLAEKLGVKFNKFRGGMTIIADPERIYDFRERRPERVVVVGYSQNGIRYIRRNDQICLPPHGPSSGDETRNSSSIGSGARSPTNGDELANSSPSVAENGDETGSSSSFLGSSPSPTYVSIVEEKEKYVRTYLDLISVWDDGEIHQLATAADLSLLERVYQFFLQKGLPQEKWDLRRFAAALRNVGKAANAVKKPKGALISLLAETGKGEIQAHAFKAADDLLESGKWPPGFDPLAMSPEERAADQERLRCQEQQRIAAEERQEERKREQEAAAKQLREEADDRERRYGSLLDDMTPEETERLFREQGMGFYVTLWRKRPADYREQALKALEKREGQQ